MNAIVWALGTFDDGRGPALFAGGGFATAGGVTVNSIARWDGSSWSSLAGPFDTGANATVDALAGFNDGPGEVLFAGGDFTSVGGLSSTHIAAWRCGLIFADGFESGDATAWSVVVR